MTRTETRSAERAEFLTDLLVTAVQSGIMYWCLCGNYRWYYPNLVSGSATSAPGPNNTATAHVTLDVEDGDEERTYEIGLDDIDRALDILNRGPVKGLSERNRKRLLHASAKNDPEAELGPGYASVVMQVVCFGEVLYG